MNLIDIAAAFAAAVLAGTGIGGGGLYVIYLTSLGLFSQSDAQALNLVFFISAATASLLYHCKRRTLKLKVIIPCAILGSLGTLLGGFCRHGLPEDRIRMFFGIMLIITGCLSLVRKRRKKKKNVEK